jgi:hypothetical protein
MDFPFEGIPTVPPRKDVDHLVRKARETVELGQEIWMDLAAAAQLICA